MAISLQTLIPIGLCIATEDLFDAKRFQQNFCDNLLLRSRDKILEPKVIGLKKDLNSPMLAKKFLEGHKTVIISNMDKILGLVHSRYASMDLKATENIISSGKMIMDRVLIADKFDNIAELESEFKSKITLPVYDLFNRSMR